MGERVVTTLHVASSDTMRQGRPFRDARNEILLPSQPFFIQPQCGDWGASLQAGEGRGLSSPFGLRWHGYM